LWQVTAGCVNAISTKEGTAVQQRIPTKALGRRFFGGAAAEVAPRLLGCILVHVLPDGVRAGRIVETEAYDQTDPASHSCRGETPRTRAMFGPGGVAYVYRSYGLHWCINVTTGPRGFGAAVLLRALEPLSGAQAMALARARGTGRIILPTLLCRGPGNLTQAMGIDGSHDGTDMTRGPLYLCAGALTPAETWAAGPRIGISVAQDVPWRFYVAGNSHVSGRRGPLVTPSRRA
jgi:DNA-3-methyladenine glycosylase